MVGIDYRLIVHRRVNRGDRHILKAKGLIQQTQQRHTAVGGAGGVGDQAFFAGQAVLVDAINDGGVDIGVAGHRLRKEHGGRPGIQETLAVGALITMPQFVDVIVPRGGKGLIARLMAEATVPMIKHLDGICHVYIDAKADIKKAIDIGFNAKCHRYGTCNTMETLLVSRAIAATVLPQLAELYLTKQVELRADPESHAILAAAAYPHLVPATEEDWSTEYLAAILSIRVVDGIDEAMDHINRYSSKHTESIITEDYSDALRFLREVDSASVMVNASTRFADGFEYGLGAEIGISNDKLHARGPVGLEGLTSLKYVVFGHGEVRK